MVWNISIDQSGYLSGFAPSQLLDFIAKPDNISVINILLVLNPKHSSYWRKINSIPVETRTLNNTFQSLQFISLVYIKTVICLSLWSFFPNSIHSTKLYTIYLAHLIFTCKLILWPLIIIGAFIHTLNFFIISSYHL